MDYTILICTHNRSIVLPRALDAIAALKIPPGKQMELVVVDSASTDRSGEVAEAFARRAVFPVRCLREERLGKSIALNTGIQAARGEFIAFTDDDGCPVPEWLLHLDAAFEKEKADWVFGRVEPIWETGRAPQWYGPRVMPLFALLDYGPEPFVVHDPLQMFLGVNNACRRASLDRVGGYRADLGPMGRNVVGSTGEDEELFRNALAAGCTIYYQPAALVRHIIPPQRCTKWFHVRTTWRYAAAQYAALRAAPSSGPRWLGLPRYYYRFLLGHAAQALRHTVTLHSSDAFHHQQQAVRFFALAWQGLRRSLRWGSA